jgi:hypothetical protein
MLSFAVRLAPNERTKERRKSDPVYREALRRQDSNKYRAIKQDPIRYEEHKRKRRELNAKRLSDPVKRAEHNRKANERRKKLAQDPMYAIKNNSMARERRKNNPEVAAKGKERNRKWRMANIEHVKQHHKEWREKNQDWLQTYNKVRTETGKMTEWRKKKLLENPRAFIANKTLKSVASTAKKKGLSFNLTQEYLESIFTFRCALTGVPFHVETVVGYGSGNAHPMIPSLDRIDPKEGYIEGNVRWVLWILNRAKGPWTDDDMKYGMLLLMRSSTEYLINQGYVLEDSGTYGVEISLEMFKKLKNGKEL